jgi:hypothetical protein
MRIPSGFACFVQVIEGVLLGDENAFVRVGGDFRMFGICGKRL